MPLDGVYEPPRTDWIRELAGAERDEWWHRALVAYPRLAGLQAKTDRLLPISVATPRDEAARGTRA